MTVMTRARSKQSLPEKGEENAQSHGFDEVAPPAWATVLVLAMVGASLGAALYITPLAFVDGTKSKMGGYGGALEVVEDGGRLLYTLASIPFFLLMILLEFLITLVSKLPCEAGRYSLADTWSSLAAGITQQMFSALVRVPLKLTIVPYTFLHHTFSVPYNLNVSATDWRAWVGGALLVDLVYYWLHRFAHQQRTLWAAHGVHHSSEHYNLSTALRQSWLHVGVAWTFYLPLALVFPPALYFALDQLNLVYQFWIHTCVVRRLGPVEWVLMTPSHHRVHHDRRVHKNFGGVLVLWDRLFGTFLDEIEAVSELGGRDGGERKGKEKEEEVCVFGTRQPLRSWTDAVTQTEELSRTWDAAAAAPTLWGKWRAVWEGPGYVTASAPRSLRAPSKSTLRLRLKSNLPPAARPYLLVQFVVAVVVGLAVLLSPKAPYLLRLCAALFLALPALYGQGLLLDGRGGAGVTWEHVRTSLLAPALILLLLLPTHACPEPFASALLSATFRRVVGWVAGWQVVSFLWLHSLRPALLRKDPDSAGASVTPLAPGPTNLKAA